MSSTTPHYATPPPGFALDSSSLPSTFQATWKANPDPSALPFPRSAPPFPLTAIDWHQLSLSDAQFAPHSWAGLASLIADGRLDELKRWPSALKAYLAWTAHVKAKYASVTEYLLSQRLFWTPLNREGGIAFAHAGATAFEDARDYAILRNDWGYAVEDGVSHAVAWSKIALPVDGQGALSAEGRRIVEEFVSREFRAKVGEREKGEKVLWFRNPTKLQTVRALEHVHVLVRGADDEVLKQWMK